MLHFRFEAAHLTGWAVSHFKLEAADPGRHPGEGGASVPGDQAPVRAHQGALPGVEEERSAGADAVRAEQPVDGQAKTDGERGVSAPEMARWGDFAGQVPPDPATSRARSCRK